MTIERNSTPSLQGICERGSDCPICQLGLSVSKTVYIVTLLYALLNEFNSESETVKEETLKCAKKKLFPERTYVCWSCLMIILLLRS